MAKESFGTLLEKFAQSRKLIAEELGHRVIGQREVVEQMLAAVLTRGHCLLVGVPGLAKTLMVSTLAQITSCSFKRIQFTPDLMPSDITGTNVIDELPGGRREYRFVPGPVFANIVLADEINRTPPKTQAALLEAMQEKQVTVAGHTRRLEEPFLVFATQNPIEHEGTYPLPEAQLDRFLFHLLVDYPSMDEELAVLERTTGAHQAVAETVLDSAGLIALQNSVHEVPLPDNVKRAILNLTHSSRPASPLADDYVKKYVSWGAGPRAAQALVRAARALALLRGRDSASIEEVKAAAPSVLRHRIIPNYNATGEGISVEDIIGHLLGKM